MAKMYFVIADVHGYYDLMIKTLNEAGFDRNNPEHILVSLGDLTDRGEKVVECVEYVMNLSSSQRILIRGNHDELVDNLFATGTFGGHDITNGTWDTIRQFAEHTRGLTISKTLAEFDWDSVMKDARRFKTWSKYYDSLRNYAEIEGFVFVHGWIPQVKQWRKNADANDWDKAIWAKTPLLTKAEYWDESGKTIICGHWHSEAWWRKDGYPHVYKTYVHPHFIAIDACTAFSNQMNCIVIQRGKIIKNINVKGDK